MTTWTNLIDGESQTIGLGATAAAAAASTSASASAASALAAAESATLAANAVSAAAATGSLPGINQCGIMIPFYIYPNNPYSDATVQALLGLIRFYRSVPVTIILNPSSGPGTVWDGNYAATITLLQGAGAQVLGYVSTAYGARAEQAVKDDILLWTTLYAATPVNGCFLDEQPYATAGGVIDLYSRYTTYAHSLSLYPVVANPGTNQQEAWFASPTADVIVVHETGSWPVESDMAGNFVGGHSNYPQRRRAALVYGQSTLDLTKLRWLRKYVNWIFIDSDVLPNPWDTLPAYLAQLFAALASPADLRLSVTDFGATGDGVSVSTTALQAAINAAAAAGGSLYIPAGLYLTGPLTVPATTAALTIFGDAADLIMESGHLPAVASGAILKLADGSNSTLLTVAVGAGPVCLRDLWLHGNQAGQASGTSFGVNFPTDGVSSYGRAGKLERVRIERCRSGAVNIGDNRNAGDIIDCTLQLCGFNSDGTAVASLGDGVLIGASNDWRIDTLDCGGHTRNGMYCTGAQNLVMYSSMFYSNGGRGFRMDATAGTARLVGCMCDRNTMDGVLLLGVGSSTKSVARTLLNCAFSANNFNGTTGVYSDIRIDDSPITSDPVQIIGCSFTDSTATSNEVKYHVEARTTTTGVLLLAPMYRTDAAKGYATAALNDRTLIDERDGPVSRNAFRVATSTSDINWLKITGGTASDGKVIIGADGSDTNIPISIRPKGSSPLYLRSTAPRLLMVNTSGATNETRAYQDLSAALLRFSLMSDDEASATRWMEVGRSGITVSYISLGGALSAETLRVTPVASQVNRVEVTGAATTGSVKVSAGGADSNVKLVVAGKGTTGGVQLCTTNTEPLGFYGTTPAAKQTITGAKGSNAALQSLLTALAALGLITDSSSA